MLSARDLSCARGELPLFESLSFDLQAGDILQVHGANGSGKTTLLRVLCGLGEPLSGTIYWQGEPISQAGEVYRAQLAYVGHSPGVKLELSPLENLRVASALSAGRPLEDPEGLLENLGLYGLEDLPARNLSAGQRRRLALARLVCSDARLWILDEPFTALDVRGVELIAELLRLHARDGGCAILTSHQRFEIDGCDVRELHLT